LILFNDSLSGSGLSSLYPPPPIFSIFLTKFYTHFWLIARPSKTLSKLSNLYSKPKLLLSLLFTKQLTLCLFLLSVSNSAALLFSLLTLTLFLLFLLLLLICSFAHFTNYSLCFCFALQTLLLLYFLPCKSLLTPLLLNCLCLAALLSYCLYYSSKLLTNTNLLTLIT